MDNSKIKYKIYVISFFIIIILILFISISFIFSKAIIKLEVSRYNVSAKENFLIDFSTTENNLKEELLKLKQALSQKTEDESIKGEIKEIKLKVSKELSIPGKGEIVESKAQGMVRIYNKGKTYQTLVKTTRLLTKDNKLFRIKSTVYIKPNGFVEVLAYSDKKGKNYEVKKGTKFTIPGLPDYKQKIVYAEAITDFTGGEKQIKKVTQKILDDLKYEFLNYVKDIALEEFQKKNINITRQHIFLIPKKITFDANIGDKLEKIKFSGEVIARAIVFDIDKIKKYLSSKLESKIEPGNKLVKIFDDSFRYEIKNIEPETKKANVESFIEGLAILEDSDFLDKSRIIGKSKQEIVSYFIKFPSIKSITVKFFPFWLKKAPFFPSHINFEIKKVVNNI